MTLATEQDLNVLYQVCVFRADRKNDMAPQPLIGWDILYLSSKIQRNLTGCKVSTSSTKFVFCRPIGNTRWPLYPLIGWDIFNFSATAEWNSTKLDWRQVLNVLWLACQIRSNHCQHVFHSKKRYSDAQLWPFWPLFISEIISFIFWFVNGKR